MWPADLLCFAHLCEGNVKSLSARIGGSGQERKTARAPYVQSKDRAHHSEQQDMRKTSRIIFLELEFASRKDGDPPAASCPHGANPAWSGQTGP